MATELYFLLGILAGSLSGSLHCVSMCGGLVLAATGGKTGWASVPYHFFRLLGYLAIGALAGYLGDWLLASRGVQGASILFALVMSVALIGTGVKLIRGRPVGEFSIPGFSGLSRFLFSIGSRWKMVRTLGVSGFFSAFLPCGWLMTFVWIAIGTGSAVRGAGVLIAFWIGTMPSLLLGGQGLEWIYRSSRGHSRQIFGCILVVMGVLSLESKFTGIFRVDPTSSAPICTTHSAVSIAN